VASACTIQERTDRVPSPGAAEDAAPTSEFMTPWGESEPPRAVRSGNLIWIWGMVGSVPGETPPRLAEGGVAGETRQALENISEILRAAGAELRDVAQCSVFLADAADVAAMTEAYREFFPSAPARISVMVGVLALGARVELECTVVVGDGA
jgi:2-iminobutanoate/2-iminopropanoate deaminase